MPEGGHGLTKREKASLNSETCSSVRESAWGWGSAVSISHDGSTVRLLAGAAWVWVLLPLPLSRGAGSAGWRATERGGIWGRQLP